MSTYRLAQRAAPLIRCRRGNFAILTAVLAPVFLLVLGMVVDFAVLSLERRRAQSAADLAALIAAQNLHAAEAATRSILALNGHDGVTEFELGRMESDDVEETRDAKPVFDVVTGRYEKDEMLAPDRRFVPGARPYNAARVTLAKRVRPLFKPIFAKPPTIMVSATASAEAAAAFSVGSRLAALREGVANALLSELTGTSVSLSVLDYNALLDADVSVFAFLDELAIRRNIVSGHYEDALDSDPTLGDVIYALARATSEGGSGAASSALDRIYAGVLSSADRIDLARVIDLGPFAKLAIGEAEAQGMPAKARAMDILFASGVVANGERLIDLDLSASAPGLARLEATLVLGEPLQHSPWLRIGVDEEVVSNVQVRLRLVATLLGEGALQSLSVRIPLYLELARAEARLADIRCRGTDPHAAEVDILARPGVLDLWLGETDLSKRMIEDEDVGRARLVNAPLLRIYGRGHAAVEETTATLLVFMADDIESGAFKSASTEDVFSSLVENLVNDSDLDINALGLSIGEGLIAQAMRATLSKALSGLDQPLAALLETLGFSIGEMDVRVNGVRCDRSVLVQ
ncbi:MAG: TadG family pilus assembly protein [Amphiplicatus sp.]